MPKDKDSVLGKLINKSRKEAPVPPALPDKTLDVFSEMRQAFQKVKELDKRTGSIPALQTEVKKLTASIGKLEAEVENIDLSGLEAKISELEKKSPDDGESNLQAIREKLAETIKLIYEAKAVLHPSNNDTALGVQVKDLDMGGKRIINLEGSEAASKKYVEETVIRTVSARGGGGLSRKGATAENEYARFTAGQQLEGRTPTLARNDILPSKTGNTLKTLRVNAGETDVEWATAGSGDMLASNNLSDVASAQTSRNNILPSKTGNTLKTLRVNAGETDYELATAGAGDMTKAVYDSNADGVIAAAQLDPAMATDAEVTTAVDAHKDLATGVHGVGVGTIAKVTDIAATKIDDLTAGDDNTDLDTNTTRHGLVPKAVAPAANVLNVMGIANLETALTNKAIFDGTNPAALGTAAPGTSLVAAHRDHVHLDPVVAHEASSADMHPQYQKESEREAVSGYAGLDGSSKVIKDPANATATATASKIPIADGSAKLDTWISASSTTVPGLAEASIASEVTTGTDVARSVTPDSLAGSDYGKRVVGVLVNDSTALTAGDGKAYFRIPSVMNGWNLVAVAAHMQAGTAAVTIMFYNVTQAADFLSTALTIDANETDSSTAAVAAVIDTANDDVAVGDWIRLDIDGAGTGTTWLYCELQFQLP